MSATPEHESAAHVPTILIADDDGDIGYLLGVILEQAGYRAIPVLSGQAVLDALKDTGNTIDLLLLDIVLGDMDAQEVVRRVRHDDIKTHIPVILISARSSVEEALQQTGVEAGISKPFTMDDLLSCVAQVLHGSTNKRVGRERHNAL